MTEALMLAPAAAAALVLAALLRRSEAAIRRRPARVRLRLLRGLGPDTGRRSPVTSGPVAHRVGRALEEADVDLPVERALRSWTAAVGAAAAIGAVAGGPAAAALSVGTVAIGAPSALLGARGRRGRRADAGLPAALDDLARSLRAGESPAEAVRAAAVGAAPTATRTELARVVGDVDRGVGLVEALTRWSVRRPSEPVRLTVAALAIGIVTGGARSRAVESVAATLRERQAADQESNALATQARASALVIALAPLGFALFTATTDPRSAAFLTGTPVGLGCLAAGLALDAAGAWWMHRIVRPPSPSVRPRSPVVLP